MTHFFLGSPVSGGAIEKLCPDFQNQALALGMIPTHLGFDPGYDLVYWSVLSPTVSILRGLSDARYDNVNPCFEERVLNDGNDNVQYFVFV